MKVKIRGKLRGRVAFDEASIDDSNRSVELVMATSAPCRMFGFIDGAYREFNEVLSMDPDAIMTERLDAGIAVLDTHSRYTMENQIGVIDSYTLDDRLKGLARFDDDAKSDLVWNKIKKKIARNGSIGYVVHEYTDISEDGDLIPTLLASRWEPCEMSIVPVGADAGSGTRAASDEEYETEIQVKTRDLNQGDKEMGTRAEQGKKKGKPAQTAAPAAREQAETVETETEETPVETAEEPEVVETEVEATAEVAASDADVEQERILGIQRSAEVLGLNRSHADTLIKNKIPLERASKMLLDKKAELDGNSSTRSQVRVEAGGHDENIHRREGMIEAIQNRADSRVKLSENGNRFRGFTLMELARECLRARGIKTDGWSKSQVVSRALSMSDFPAILSGASVAALRRYVAQADTTHRQLAAFGTLPDYNEQSRAGLESFPELLEVKEGGEYKLGTLSEGKEKIRLGKYGRIIAITREMILSDRLDAFRSIPQGIANAGVRLEARLFWGQVTSNPKMGDGKTLFHADHGNLGVASAPNLAGVDAGYSAMAGQEIGDDPAGIAPKFLVVPTLLGLQAKQLTTSLTPNSPAEVNPYSDELTPISSAHLQQHSNQAWYLFADPNQFPAIEIDYLEGEDLIQVEEEADFDTDVVKTKVRVEVGVKAVDAKAIYKNPGVTPTP